MGTLPAQYRLIPAPSAFQPLLSFLNTMFTTMTKLMILAACAIAVSASAKETKRPKRAKLGNATSNHSHATAFSKGQDGDFGMNADFPEKCTVCKKFTLYTKGITAGS